MGTHNYVYDPEGAPVAGLKVGVRVQGKPPSANHLVEVHHAGATIGISRRDLIVPRKKPEARLQEAAVDVAHELRMLVLAYLRSTSDPIAYIAWFVHLRNLMDFFEGKGHDGDDVTAQDYFSGSESDWHATRRTIKQPRSFPKYRGYANKLAAHLTYKRAALRGKSPKPNKAVTEHLGNLAAVFLTRLPPARRKWFVDQLLPAI